MPIIHLHDTLQSTYRSIFPVSENYPVYQIIDKKHPTYHVFAAIINNTKLLPLEQRTTTTWNKV